MVEHDHLRAAANLSVITEALALPADGTAVHADPNAIGPAGGFRDPVVQVPDFKTPLVIPLNPLAIHWVAPIFLAGNSFAGAFLKSFLTVVAVARGVPSQAAPAVICEPL